MRDALPDLIHGRLSESDRAVVTAHVESCVDCCAEVELLREVRASAPQAPPMSAERIASAIDAYARPNSSDVVRPLNEYAQQSRRSIWKLAAVAVLIALGGAALSEMDFGGQEEGRRAASPGSSESPSV